MNSQFASKDCCKFSCGTRADHNDYFINLPFTSNSFKDIFVKNEPFYLENAAHLFTELLPIFGHRITCNIILPASRCHVWWNNFALWWVSVYSFQCSRKNGGQAEMTWYSSWRQVTMCFLEWTQDNNNNKVFPLSLHARIYLINISISISVISTSPSNLYSYSL